MISAERFMERHHMTSMFWNTLIVGPFNSLTHFKKNFKLIFKILVERFMERHYIGSRHVFMELAGMLWAIPSSFSFLAFPNRLDLIACGMIIFRDRDVSGGGELCTEGTPRVCLVVYF